MEGEVVLLFPALWRVGFTLTLAFSLEGEGVYGALSLEGEGIWIRSRGRAV